MALANGNQISKAQIADMKDIGSFSAGLQRNARGYETDNTIRINDSTFRNQNYQNQKAADVARDVAGAANGAAQYAANEQARQAQYVRSNQNEQNRLQRELESNNASKTVASQLGQASYQLDGVREQADASRYGAAQSARAGITSALFGSLSSQQGWKYW